MSLLISREISQHLASASVRAAPTIELSGKVSVLFDDEFQRDDQTESIPLDQLVADAVSQEMLQDETDAAQILLKFRSRLLKSLEHIDEAIASLPKP